MTWLNKFGAVLAFLVVAAFGSAPAVAQSSPFQTGGYLGPTVGVYSWSNELDVNASGFGSLVNLDGLSMPRRVLPGATAGFDFRFGNSPFLAGAFVDRQFGEGEFDLSVAGLGSVVSASIGNETIAGLRVGLVSGNWLFYAGAYYAMADFDWQIGNSKIGVLAKGSEDLRGHGFLLGAEGVVWGHAVWGVKGGYTDYERVRYDLGGANLDITPSGAWAKTTLVWRLEDLKLFGK